MKLMPIFILLFMIVLPAALAEVRVDTVKGYLNNEREINVDENGGYFQNVARGDNLDLTVTIANTFNYTIQARLRGTLQDIDNGDDLDEEQPWYNIGEEGDRTKTLAFSIPTDVMTDDYRLYLNVDWKYPNGTVRSFDGVRYDVEVRGGDKTVQEDLLTQALRNMSLACGDIAESTNTCFGYIGRANNCSAELSTVKEERGTYKQRTADQAGTISTLKTEKATLQTDKDNLEAKVKNMITVASCDVKVRTVNATAFDKARKEAASSNNKTLALIVAGVALAYYLLVYKKKKKTVEGAYFSQD